MSKTAKATFALMVVTILSKILGLLRESVLASAYGTGVYAAAYTTANSIPIVLFAIIGSSLATSLIPLYSRLSVEDSEERAIGFLNTVINIVIIVSIVLSVIGIVFAGPLVRLFAPGFKGQTYNLCVNYTRMLLPSLVFVGLANVYTAYLQVKKRFVASGIIGMPYSLIIIGSIIISINTSPNVLVWGTLLAIASKALIQLPFLYKEGYKYSTRVDLKDPIMKDMMVLILPVVIGVGANQISAIVDKSLASLLGANVVSSFAYATRLYEFVQALFIASILAVIFPKLSKLAVSDKMDSFITSMKQTINVVLIALVPVVAGCIVLAKPIVEILLQRKAFTANDTVMTATILMIYVTGIIAFSVRDVMSRGFYSMGDSKTPMFNGIIAITLNIILDLVLIKPLGYTGLALATSISAYIALVVFIMTMKKRVENFTVKDNLIVFAKCLIASLIMSLVVYFIYYTLGNILVGGFMVKLVRLAASVMVGVVVYIVVMYLSKVEEFMILFNMVKNIGKNKIKKVTN